MALQVQAPNPVDVHVGGRVRLRRKLIGLSQDQLADALGLTFQQVQKYERGSNRISASKLYAIAQTLGVPIAFFFDGFENSGDDADEPQAGSERAIMTFIGTPEGLELARMFPKIRRGPVRRQVLDLVRIMSQTNDA